MGKVKRRTLYDSKRKCEVCGCNTFRVADDACDSCLRREAAKRFWNVRANSDGTYKPKNPCRECGASERYVKNHRCVECVRLREERLRKERERKVGGAVKPSQELKSKRKVIPGLAYTDEPNIPEDTRLINRKAHVDNDIQTSRINSLFCAVIEQQVNDLKHFRVNTRSYNSAKEYLTRKSQGLYEVCNLAGLSIDYVVTLGRKFVRMREAAC